MTAIFLHGGGDDPASRRPTLGRFVQAATHASTCRLALIIAEATTDEAQQNIQAYQTIFESMSIASFQVFPLFTSPIQPLQRTMLETIQPTGVFVCGGLTPLYHQALCADRSWVEYLDAAQLPYGGTSAGAAIAARRAIVGGWQATRANETRPILFPGASEGLDELTVKAGLGLVPFAVDVHASQMGTLTRLLHAVDLGLAMEGWAIDENTLLHVTDQGVAIYGQGQAYHVQRQGQQSLSVTIHPAS